MEKHKLPELKVSSFITALDSTEMNRIKGGVNAADDSFPLCSALIFDCDETETACSSSDVNHGVGCMGA